MLHKKKLLQRAGILAVAAVVSTSGLLFQSASSIAATAEESTYEIFQIDVISQYAPLQFSPVAFNHDVHIDSVGDCEACHLTNAEGDMSEFFLRTENVSAKQLQDVYHDGCISCHANMVVDGQFSGPLASECRNCHLPANAPLALVPTDEEKALLLTQAQVLDFLTGPMLWASFLIFALGMFARAILYIMGLDWRLDRVAYTPHMGFGLKGAFHSVLSWILPFRTYGWRKHPYMTVAFFLFHTGVIVVPLFLAGHNVLMQVNFGFSLPTFPPMVADVLTVLALAGFAMMVLRRLVKPEVRILNTAYDWFILILAVAPLVTGLVARFGVCEYNIWLLAHIITSEALLILAPFTKLSHIVLFFLSRGQLGMDYAIKRGGSSRGSAFPW